MTLCVPPATVVHPGQEVCGELVQAAAHEAAAPPQLHPAQLAGVPALQLVKCEAALQYSCQRSFAKFHSARRKPLLLMHHASS